MVLGVERRAFGLPRGVAQLRQEAFQVEKIVVEWLRERGYLLKLGASP